MAAVNTTLASAMGVSDTVMVVASASSLNPRDVVELDGEQLQITANYNASTQGVNVPVLRGQGGTVNAAHPSGALVHVASASDTAFGSQAPQTVVQYPIATPARQRASYSATGAIALPNPGNDLVVFLNGTSVLAMTVAAPSSLLDGSLLWIASNGAAAHTVTFTGGLSGASSNYDVITVNATAPVLLGPFMAVNGLWQGAVSVPMAGTVTNITATVA